MAETQPLSASTVDLDEELENIYVTFLCCGYLEDTLFTAGDDGFLYIWEHQRIIRRIPAHDGAIYALDCNPRVGFVASGGMEGVVILWRLLVERCKVEARPNSNGRLPYPYAAQGLAAVFEVGA